VEAFARAIVIVLDGLGVGALPDAAAYGDVGSDTLGHVAASMALRLPALKRLGLGRVSALGATPFDPDPIGAFGRMAEASPGKDSVTGHWELMGLVVDRRFPVFPDGFPAPTMAALSRATGRGVIGNKAASGTAIIEELGLEHLRTGALIVYTSADSVLQIAAHEAVVPVAELYRACERAYDLACLELGVGRVIARPFVGSAGSFERTPRRRDYAVPPPGETLLDRLVADTRVVVTVGKVADLFGGRGVTRSVHTTSDEQGMDRTAREMRSLDRGLILTNLVDCDSKFGHRNDVEGYAANLERFDARLGNLISGLRDTDLLVVTADHGNDPSTVSTDHSREFVPVLLAGPRVRPGVDLGTRQTFADLGQSLATGFGVGPLAHGTSFLHAIMA
jgi:phosphopentomutase